MGSLYEFKFRMRGLFYLSNRAYGDFGINLELYKEMKHGVEK
jgi:hypothetical protein